MKKFTLAAFVCTSIMLLHWSCTKQTLMIDSNELSSETLAMKKGNKGNNDYAIYSVEYTGALEGIAYGPSTRNNKKTQVIGAKDCLPFNIKGLSTLLEDCFTDDLDNVFGPSVRLIDRRVDPQLTRVSVWLLISFNGSNHWLKLFGSICNDGSCSILGGSNILPGENDDPIWMKMDRLVVETTEGCATDETLTKDIKIKVEWVGISSNPICP